MRLSTVQVLPRIECFAQFIAPLKPLKLHLLRAISEGDQLKEKSKYVRHRVIESRYFLELLIMTEFFLDYFADGPLVGHAP